MKEKFEKEFDTAMKQALIWKTEHIEPSENLLQNIKTEIKKEKKENGFMKKNMKQMIAVAAVCVLSVTCYAATQLDSVVSHGSSDIKTFAGLEKAEKKLGFDAKYVETFTNGMTFQRGGTGKTQGLDAEGNPVGKKYKTMTVTYSDEAGNSVSLNIDGGSPYVDAGVEETEGYSTDTYMFVPPNYEVTEEERAKEAAGELVISVGSEEVEIMQMEYYGWEEDGVYYSLVGFDCGFGEDAMQQMAEEVKAQ